MGGWAWKQVTNKGRNRTIHITMDSYRKIASYLSGDSPNKQFLDILNFFFLKINRIRIF